MMRFVIDGEITSATVRDFMASASELEEGEDIELKLTSEGGSVVDGNIIVSKLRELSRQGHRSTAHVVSIAASMASVIACACDRLILDSNAFLMIHQVWTTVAGNADDLRKEANTLDLFTKSLISVYRTKFDKTDDELLAMLKDETWILGEQADEYGLKCLVNDVGEDLEIAAKLVDFKKRFNNMRKDIESVNMEIKEEEMKKEETAVEQVTETTTSEEALPSDPPATEELVETKPTYEELEKLVEELKKRVEELETVASAEKNVTEDECQKRVSGMQSKMQLKLNDFTNQLKVKDEELTKANAMITSLSKDFEACKKELSAMTSAYAAKEDALAKLNANVNKMPEETTSNKTWRDFEGKEFFDFLKKNNNIIKISKIPNK